MKKKQSGIRFVPVCILLLSFVLPGTAMAASFQYDVTIESEYNDAFDYLEYYKDGSWHDLNTPKHWIEGTGQVCYCIQHSYSSPHGESYTAYAPGNIFSGKTLKGLQAILMNGYPCKTPSGFTADQARQATANAIRFWLCEQGESGSYEWTNRKTNPDKIRAKSGYSHVLSWADELLQQARSGAVLTHSITFTPASIELKKDGDVFSGQLQVELTNINSGYELDTSNMPEGVSYTGFTGSGNDTLTFTAPLSFSGKTFQLTAKGKDTRSVDNITAYVPSGSSFQKVFLCATTAQVVATTTVGINTPSYGSLKISKTGETGEALAGVKFGVYADSACTVKLGALITGSDGTAAADYLPAGTVYVKELGTVSPYVLDSSVYDAVVEVNGEAALSIQNVAAKGQIRIHVDAEQLICVTGANSDHGSLTVPVYEKKGLPGCVFGVYDKDNRLLTSAETDENGDCETGFLELGTYTVEQISSKDGYMEDSNSYPVTLKYKDANTPMVKASVDAVNKKIDPDLVLKKVTEQFDSEENRFLSVPGNGYVFGLYALDSIGPIQKDALLDILITNAEGVAENTARLPFGSYYLKELKAGDKDVQISNALLPVTLNGHNTDYYESPIVNEMVKGTISIQKSDASTLGSVLEGAVYEVRKADGTLVSTMTTDRKGKAVSSVLPAGKYTVQEIKAPDGFNLSEEVIEVKLKGNVTYERSNTPNSITIQKTDSATGVPVCGAFYAVYDVSGKKVFDGDTDLDGKLIFGRIPAGRYSYKEYEAPEGYSLDKTSHSFTVDEHGNVTGDTTVSDDPIALSVHAVNVHTELPFEKLEYVIQNGSGERLKLKKMQGGYYIPSEDGQESAFTDSHGILEIRYLKAGVYTLTQKTPEGYFSEGEYQAVLSNSCSIEEPCRLEMRLFPTAVRILKVEANTGKKLSGAVFQIKVRENTDYRTLTFHLQSDGSYIFDRQGNVKELISDENGEVLIYGIPLMQIFIEEAAAPKGYFPVSAVEVELNDTKKSAEPFEVKIENSRFVKLGKDSDRFEIPAMVFGGIAVISGILVYVFVLRKRRRV